MPQPVKLSDALVLDARLTGEVTERSIAGQIEFWASLGRSLERLLRLDQVLALKRQGQVEPLSGLLASVNSTEGQSRLQQVLNAKPYPHYEAAPTPGHVIRIEADGTRAEGRFVQRTWVPTAT